MEGESELDRGSARTAAADRIPTLIHEHREDILRALLETRISTSCTYA